MSDKPIVWIPQEPMRRENGAWVSKGLNLAATKEFGEMSIIWGPDTSILSRAVMLQTAEGVARNYNPARDYILALGSPSLIAILSWALGRAGKPIRMLEWDKQLRSYYPTMLEHKG